MWKESYRVGVDLIDTQHQELFHRVSDFLQAIKSDGDWEQKVEKVKETSDFMQKYVIEHFSDEEAFQQSIHYDQYEKHHQVHENFKAEVAKLAQKLEDSQYHEEVAQEFAGKLMTWLIYHVAMEDQKIGEYVRHGGESQ